MTEGSQITYWRQTGDKDGRNNWHFWKTKQQKFYVFLLICSTFINALNQLHSILLFIFTSSRTISLFQFIHLIYIYLEQKVKVDVDVDKKTMGLGELPLCPHLQTNSKQQWLSVTTYSWTFFMIPGVHIGIDGGYGRYAIIHTTHVFMQ